MKYNVRYKPLRDGTYANRLLEECIEKLQAKHPEHQLEKQFNKEYDTSIIGYGGIYCYLNLSIINPSTGKYLVISAVDNWRKHYLASLGWQPENMCQFLYSGGFRYNDYYALYRQKINYEPFFYGPYKYGYDELMTTLYNESSDNGRLGFRGYLFHFRKQLLGKYQKNSDVDIFDVRSGEPNVNLDYVNYLKDLASYKCCLSLPGMTEICNRDIEAFAVGTPVIRPVITTQYPDPLIPEYHYISCYDSCSYSLQGNPEYNKYGNFMEEAYAVWGKVKNNKEYLDFVARNARDWYLKNCTIENNSDYIVSKINLEALNG